MGIPERELLGYVPAETHEHYDADGNYTGRTVVTREPRWTDHERHRLLAKLEHDTHICEGCGVHSDLIEADDLMLSPTTRVCPLCAAREQLKRVLAEADEKAETAAGEVPAATPRPGDGRHLATDVKPIPPGG